MSAREFRARRLGYLGVVTVEVRPVDGSPGRYEAGIAIDGVSHSWDCTHLHHTPAAADRCRRRVEADWREWIDAGATVEYVGTTEYDRLPLYEARIPLDRDHPDAGYARSRRFAEIPR